jgi:hypothetical protein
MTHAHPDRASPASRGREAYFEAVVNACQNIVNPADRKDMLLQVEKSAAARRPFSFIHRVRAADGQEKWAWEQGEGVFNDSDRLVALEGFITDVTAYKGSREGSRGRGFKWGMDLPLPSNPRTL